jgi:hypothetical protein
VEHLLEMANYVGYHRTVRFEDINLDELAGMYLRKGSRRKWGFYLVTAGVSHIRNTCHMSAVHLYHRGRIED